MIFISNKKKLQNYLLSFSSQWEVRGVIASGSTEFFSAVSDSREKRCAACVTQSVWDLLSPTSTHNHHSVPISREIKHN